MKKISIVLLLLNISLFAQFSQPKISSLEMDYSFGDIKEGETVKHNFVIFNKGGDLLKIEKVKASCGCTAATPSKSELAPNDSTMIEVSFNSARRMGAQKKYVYVFSNDPETPQLRLSFTANILPASSSKFSNAQPEIKLSKYNHNFGNVKEGEVLHTVIEVSNSGLDDLEIKDVKSSCGCTAALMSSKVLKPNEKADLKIDFNTKNLNGQIARTVTLYSNDLKNPTRVLTIIANVEKE